MKFLRQFLYILLFSFTGEFLQAWIPLPIPAAIYGIILMLIALMTGILKREHISDTAQFLISFMPVLFIIPVVKILQYRSVIAPKIGAILIIVAVSTFFVFGVAGLVSKWCLGKKGGNAHE